MDDEQSEKFEVFVSRLPTAWSEEQLRQHFEACFGNVLSVTIKTDDTSNKSLGYGFVVFSSQASQEAALEQQSIHAKKRIIQIRPIGYGQDTNVCYLWQRHQCVRGDNCKFLHEGDGGCLLVSAPGEGKRKKCISFKSKGKCSKGDACPFLHVVNTDQVSNPKQISPKSICHAFQKRGICRKGTACKFQHIIGDTSETNSEEKLIVTNEKKRSRIDGKQLVEKRKKLLASVDNGGEVAV
jgi:RNA recognition motif-containing protein